jgi:4-azaleucine resistance transporter AzlC
MKPAVKHAFIYTIPMIAGYMFTGIAFGVLFASKGYSFIWCIMMAIIVYAGSAQFLLTSFFVPGFSLIQVFLLVLVVNFRHVFYGISLLEPFYKSGKKRWYMIYGLTDETYSLLCTVKVPEGVRQDLLYFFITFITHIYWIIGCAIGGLAGSILPLPTEGIDFAMVALFICIFLDLTKKKGNVYPGVLGIVTGIVFLLIFGGTGFVPPALLFICATLLIFRKFFEKGEENADRST